MRHRKIIDRATSIFFVTKGTIKWVVIGIVIAGAFYSVFYTSGWSIYGALPIQMMAKIYGYMPSSYDRLRRVSISIGAYQYRRYGLQGVKRCDSSLHFACYYGLFIEAMRMHGDSITTLRTLARACDPSMDVTAKYIECARGFGHTLLWLNTFWYIESLQQCDVVFDQAVLRNACWEGVSYENAHREGELLRTMYATSWEHGNVYYPCDSIPLGYQPACVSQQVSAIGTVLYAHDREKMEQYCRYFTQTSTVSSCLLAVKRYVYEKVRN